MGVMNLQEGFKFKVVELQVFHDKGLMILMLIFCLSFGVLFTMIVKENSSLDLVDHQSLEVIWTVLPGVILFMLAMFSMELLYNLEAPISSEEGVYHSFKATGRQWYWTYGYWGDSEMEYDSYMVGRGELGLGDLRALEVDLPLVVPSSGLVRGLITASDVIHNFAMPALGVKVDAMPGRMNQILFFSGGVGAFYGQCSELCGVDHSYMPIGVEVVDSGSF